MRCQLACPTHPKHSQKCIHIHKPDPAAAAASPVAELRLLTLGVPPALPAADDSASAGGLAARASATRSPCPCAPSAAPFATAAGAAAAAAVAAGAPAVGAAPAAPATAPAAAAAAAAAPAVMTAAGAGDAGLGLGGEKAPARVGERAALGERGWEADERGDAKEPVGVDCPAGPQPHL
jgi:hypothetical protein